jgi:hypothetical protein
MGLEAKEEKFALPGIEPRESSPQPSHYDG